MIKHELESAMRQALQLAERGAGWASPNPTVGAVVLDSHGKKIGEGWHERVGGPHAEVMAIQSVRNSRQLRKSTLVVTLEPCSTYGRTPPCIDAIIANGIKKVVIGCLDPNPAHAGRALKILKGSGIDVKSGILEESCRRQIRSFGKWVTTGRPWVTAKMAVSLDGRLTRPPGESQWLTSSSARADVQELRSRVDAILVGAGTVRADDPQLSVRLPKDHPRSGRQPLRVVLADKLPLPSKARLFSKSLRQRTIIYRSQPLTDVLDLLGRRQVTSLLVEGGSAVFGSLFSLGLVDEVVAYVAPMVCGTAGRPVVDLRLPGGSMQLSDCEWQTFGPDVRLRACVST